MHLCNMSFGRKAPRQYCKGDVPILPFIMHLTQTHLHTFLTLTSNIVVTVVVSTLPRHICGDAAAPITTATLSSHLRMHAVILKQVPDTNT